MKQLWRVAAMGWLALAACSGWLALGGCAADTGEGLSGKSGAPVTGVLLPELDEYDIGTEPVDAIVLPIEVMPMADTQFFPATDPDKLEVSRTFNISYPLPADGKLLIVGHRLGYRDGHEIDFGGGPQLVKDGKASVRLGNDLSCDWIPLTNDQPGLTLKLPDHYYGGIGGGFNTVRLTIDLSTFDPSCLSGNPDTIYFRFDGSDGVSSGYRILYFNILDAGELHLINNDMVNIAPSSWSAPAGGDPNLGYLLWHKRKHLTAPTATGTVNMIASCADCHEHDGGDLEYFAYSNESIINRAVFHGLSITKGEHIAAHIRGHGAPRYGRPWNPPYQPGTYTDDSLVNHEFDTAGDWPYWSAGAGLQAVLDDELAQNTEVLEKLLGLSCDPLAGCTVLAGGSVSDHVADIIRGTGLDARTINLRNIPIALQLPDWNAWLPEHHPIDMWGEDYWLSNASFAHSVKHSTGLHPAGMAIGDIDGDGRNDIAVSSDSTLYLYTGDNDGRLVLLDTVTTGSGGRSVAIGDFDNDGDNDLAVANYYSDDISIVTQDPGPTFTVSSLSTGLLGPYSVGSGDFNGDGTTDLAVAFMDSDSLQLLRSTGSGFAVLTTFAAGDMPSRLAVADLNGDGRSDIAVSGYASDDVHIFHSDIAGSTYTVLSPITVENGAKGLDIADLNADGHLDIAVVNEHDDEVSIILADGAGGYLTPSNVTVGDGPTSVASGDYNCDGLADLAVTNIWSEDISLLLGQDNDGDGLADGTFAAPISKEGADIPKVIVAADFDGNNCSDIAVVNWGGDYGMYLHLGTQRPEHVYDHTHAQLAAMATVTPYPAADLPGVLRQLTNSAKSFVGTGMWPVPGAGSLYNGWRGHRGRVIDDAVLNGYQHEMVKRNLAQWAAVKYWELMHVYQLQDKGPDVHPGVAGVTNPTPIPDGEVLSWPMGGTQAVHPIAPHITSLSSNQFRSDAQLAAVNPAADVCSDTGVTCPPQTHARQINLKGDYDSTAWYHLQLLLNAGARNVNPLNTDAAEPWDIGYAYIHIDDVARAAEARYPAIVSGGVQYESLRYLATMIKAYQMRDNEVGPEQAGWSLRDVSPRLLLSNFSGDADKDHLMQRWDYHGAGLRTQLTNAFLEVFLEVVNRSGFVASYSVPTIPGFYAPGARCSGIAFSATPSESVLACQDEGNVRRTWWKLSPADYQVTVTRTMDTALGPLPAGTLIREDYLTSTLSVGDLEKLGYAGGVVPDIQNEFTSGKLNHADDIYRSIPLFAALGVDLVQLCGLIDWGELQWPGPGWTPSALSSGTNNWNAWRLALGC